MAVERNTKTGLAPVMWVALIAAATLVVFLSVACDEARPGGIVAAALWIPLIYGMFRALKGHHVLAIAVAFPIAQLTLIMTLLLTCPGSGGRSALAVGMVAFLIFGLVLGASVGSLEQADKEK